MADHRRFEKGEVAYEYIEDGVLICALETGDYFQLDAVGAQLWEWLVTLGDLDQVEGQMGATYELDRDAVHQHLNLFVARLCDMRLGRAVELAE